MTYLLKQISLNANNTSLDQHEMVEGNRAGGHCWNFYYRLRTTSPRSLLILIFICLQGSAPSPRVWRSAWVTKSIWVRRQDRRKLSLRKAEFTGNWSTSRFSVLSQCKYTKHGFIYELIHMYGIYRSLLNKQIVTWVFLSVDLILGQETLWGCFFSLKQVELTLVSTACLL